ncbi:MAG: sialidase family protein [Planctomycetia bacterium]|nr:sialidase family protein [Planctomycetia bacterium]
MRKMIPVAFILFASIAMAQEKSLFLQPWDESLPYPAASEVAFPEGLRHVIVQDCDADPEWKFLHETAVGFCGEELVVAWYNNLEHELSGKTIQRARRSSDDGKTWSEPELVKGVPEDKMKYVGIQFLEMDGKFYAFSNMEFEKGFESLADCLLMEYDKAAKKWNDVGMVCKRFLAMQQPILMDDGNYIISGSYNIRDGANNGVIPVVYVSQGKDIAKPWKRYLMDTEYVNVFAETAIVVNGANVLGVTRLEASPYPNFYESNDFGKTWRKLENKTFLASSSKFAAGTLSNGVRYILYNLPNFTRDANGKPQLDKMNRGRHTLVIATAQPEDTAFTKIWKVSDVTAGADQKMSHYPCAVEHDGKLYISYTGQHTRRNAGLTIVPIESLK